jgi:ABC-type multidrug transport system fused ATPase/permease subunit
MLTVYTALIIIELSWVGILAPIVIILSIFIQAKLNGVIAGHDSQRKKIADKRVKKVTEMVIGCKMIKFNAWEKVMLKVF